ncbi:MAG TPA: hypothetical protein VEZ40_17690 [Pyrinomonadaceae bacterium]|nr:hypothetical protein [Pyrinomonadaceae bacterium]
MTEDKNDERVRFLLEQKISYLNTVGNVCMAWWVSSVVFCGTILAAVWLNRTELAGSGVIKWLGFVLASFFATVVVYGIVILKYLNRFQAEISALASELNHEDFFSNEIKTFKRAMVNGTSSFAIILIAWIFLWMGLWSGFWVNQSP